jgi:hypothetical protein
MRDLHAAADHAALPVLSLLFWFSDFSIADWSCHLVVQPQNQ